MNIRERLIKKGLTPIEADWILYIRELFHGKIVRIEKEMNQ